MKTLVTYYSYSGKTQDVVNIFKEALEKRGEARIQRLRPKKEITSFFGQCIAARYKKRCAIEEALFDAGDYDTIIIGSPVWAFAPVPAINTYLDRVSGLKNKKLIILLTYHSGLGVKECFKYLHTALAAQGASDIREVGIPNAKMEDKDFIVASLEKVL